MPYRQAEASIETQLEQAKELNAELLAKLHAWAPIVKAAIAWQENTASSKLGEEPPKKSYHPTVISLWNTIRKLSPDYRP